MDRRKSLKLLGLSVVGTGVLVEACKNADKKSTIDKAATGDPNASFNRIPEEEAAYKKITAEKFFTEEEMATIAVLSDIIIPRDTVSGSATDAKVPDFIEFIVKEKTEFQVPMRGGLRWLNLQSVKMFEKPFKEASSQQQITLVDQIAYPNRAKAEMKQGVAFFNLLPI